MYIIYKFSKSFRYLDIHGDQAVIQPTAYLWNEYMYTIFSFVFFFFFFFNKSQSFVLKRHTPRGKPAIVLFGCESERTKAVARMHKPGGPNQTLNPTLFFTVQSLLSANARPIFVLPKQRVRFPRGSGSDYIIAKARYNTREKLN